MSAGPDPEHDVRAHPSRGVGEQEVKMVGERLCRGEIAGGVRWMMSNVC